MKRFRDVLLAVVFTGALVAFIGLVLWGMVEGIQDSPALIGSLGTAALGVIGGLAVAGYQGRVERQEAAERKRREEITPFYVKLLAYIRGLAEAADEGADSSGELTAEDKAFLQDLQDKLLLWGRAPMIKAWVDGMRVAERPDNESRLIDSILAYASVLLAIRAELGHDDSQLDVRDLLRVFVTDIDEHFPPGQIGK